MAKTLDDYLGCKGLDHSGQMDELGERKPATWQPIDDGHEFGLAVVERFKNWRTLLEKNGLLQTWRRNYRQYFNGPAAPGDGGMGWGWTDSFQILGESGEILNVRLAEPRNLITHMVNLACAKPVALRAIAKDSTPEALEAAQIADSVIKEDFDPTSGGQLIRECVEMALAITCGFLDPEWDIFAGEAYVPDPERNGGMYYSGGPKITVRFPDEVCFDLTKRRWDEVEQCVVLQKGNRYLLASQFPDLAEKILNVPSLADSEFKPFRYEDEKTDDIVVFRYVHKAGNRSFLPEGRLSLVLEDGTVLRDGSNPYALVDPKIIGIFPITAASGLGTVYGYATMNDLSPLSQWLNLMATMAATLIAGYGAPNITGPIMTGVQVQHMVGGGRYFGVPAQQAEIKPLNLLDGRAMDTLVKMMELVMQVGEKHSGMNSVMRGEGGDHSGKYVALVKSLAVQFMSSLQNSIISVSEQLGNYLIRMRQAFSTSEEVAQLSGETDLQQVKPYKAAATFPMVAKVRAEAVDPLSQTPEGREERAQFLMDKGAFTTPQQFMTLVKTGRDEPLFKAPMANVNLINRENQMLMKGQVPKVLADDLHDIHIPEHLANLADPSVRDNDAIVQANLEHVARHKMAAAGIPFMQGMDPATGQPYPPATQQFAMAQAKMQMAQQQAAMQAGAPGPQQGGPPQGPPSKPPAGPGGPPQQGPPPHPATAVDAMQQAAQGPA